MIDEHTNEEWARRGSELEGRSVLVTGAAKGIGRGIALVMAEQGANVTISDLDQAGGERTADQIRELGVDAHFVRHDVTSVQSSYSAVAEVVERFGKLDVLVNNAGVVRAVPMLEVDEAEWNREVEINQKGLFFCTQAAATQMRKQGQGGSIVNIASRAALQAESNYSVYSATKAAVVSLTRSIAKELSADDIRGYAICPGTVITPLWEDNLRRLSQIQGGRDRDEILTEIIDRTPLGRPQTARDIGELASFLASDRGRNISGVAISVTGGEILH